MKCLQISKYFTAELNNHRSKIKIIPKANMYHWGNEKHSTDTDLLQHDRMAYEKDRCNILINFIYFKCEGKGRSVKGIDIIYIQDKA